MWDWVLANLPSLSAFLRESPLTTVVLAASHQDRNNAGPTPDEVLRGCAHLIDDGYRTVKQAERMLIEQARAAGWSDDRTRDALLLPSDVDLDTRLDELNAMVFRRDRPPVA
ncbi:hypothetical protein PSU4_50190 [Pseudonocardia sulfidoxydans NBRC 16205]|uniref:Uncharacterized protein n=1 Tax=Pseudonocardia sulfidoxydans NBRC 16205 TaxID=1223511 RepID=A0A511DMM8_9PSEU|nr:hypothetical protein PSU4_50190 [Pseudonocardia sulfidoxydans NBRC 16205]